MGGRVGGYDRDSREDEEEEGQADEGGGGCVCGAGDKGDRGEGGSEDRGVLCDSSV